MGGWLTLGRDRVQRLHEFRRRQLDEFYAPFCALRQEIKAKGEVRVLMSRATEVEWEAELEGLSADRSAVVAAEMRPRVRAGDRLQHRAVHAGHPSGLSEDAQPVSGQASVGRGIDPGTLFGTGRVRRSVEPGDGRRHLAHPAGEDRTRRGGACRSCTTMRRATAPGWLRGSGEGRAGDTATPR
jgi:hypothetical protein